MSRNSLTSARVFSSAASPVGITETSADRASWLRPSAPITAYETPSSAQLADVAKRAGVNKTTVYRRWPTKALLVADLMAQFTRSAVATPDTGALQSDLELLLTEIADALEDRAVRAVLYAALAAGDSNDDILAARTGFWAERFARSGEIVERACLRGELPVGVDPRTFLEMASGPIYFRALFSDDDVDRRFIEEVAARIVRGYRAD